MSMRLRSGMLGRLSIASLIKIWSLDGSKPASKSINSERLPGQSQCFSYSIDIGFSRKESSSLIFF